VLTTDRLVLRQVTMADAEDVLVFRGDAQVQRYDSGALQGIDEVHELIDEADGWYADQKALVWGVTLKGMGHVIGLFAFYFWEQRYYVADLGYDLARAHWRQGIATEAIGEMLRWGFEELRMHRVNANTRTDNRPSVALLRRLGFTHEGTARECIRSDDGSYQNWGVFGMLAGEYAAH